MPDPDPFLLLAPDSAPGDLSEPLHPGRCSDRARAVADVVEAMCTRRPYRPALPLSAAIEELGANRGRLYSATAVDACLRLLKAGKLDFKK